MPERLVQLAAADRIATVTLDSPGNRNALSADLVNQLRQHLATAENDPSCHAIVLTHAGPTFCAGADLAEVTTGGSDAATARLLDLLKAVVELPKPLVARLTGSARAGGLGLIAACDLAYAARSVTFAFSEVRLGVAPAVISLTTLPRLDGRSAARYFLTGDVFDAEEAARIGLLTECADDVDTLVDPALDSLRAARLEALAETKRLLTAPLRTALTEHGQDMAALSAKLFASPDAQAVMKGFLRRKR